jgi:bacterioferritin-associated ferredoxin
LAKTIVCHCEDITLEELYSALEQGYNEIESIKRFTGIATGKCQGKCCLIQTLRELDSAPGRSAVRAGSSAGPGSPLSPPTDTDLDAAIRLPTIRQPVVPLKIDDIVEAGERKGRA